MGAVKSHYHDEICERANEQSDQEPDDLEMLKIDAEQAARRYEEALKQRNPRTAHEPF